MMFQVRHFARKTIAPIQSAKKVPLPKNAEILIDDEQSLLAFLEKEGLEVPFKKKQEIKEKVDLKQLERRQAKIESQLVKPEQQTTKPMAQKIPIKPTDDLDIKMLSQFSTGDDTLNNHALGNIPLKYVDFTQPQYYQQLQLKRTDSKRQVYDQMFDKLRIMFDSKYTSRDFDQLKLYHFNSDQLLALMSSQNFIQNAQRTRLVDCLKSLQKSRQIKVFKHHPDIMNVVNTLAQDNVLAALPQSYVAAFAHAISKAKIDDEKVWFKLAAHLSQRHEQYNVRDLSTFTYALTNVSKHQPVILNFDELFRKLELSFVKKFDSSSGISGQDISITLTSFSKSQNGSVQFWQAFETIIINNQHKLSTQELSNCIYSYWKAEHAQQLHLYEALKPLVRATLHQMKPVELCQVLMAFTEVEEGALMDDQLIRQFEVEFGGRFESMNPQDSSQFYYCFTKLGFVGDGMFYKYVQKAVTKTIRSFEGPHLRLMFYKFDHADETRLNRGVRGRLIEHLRYLIRENQLKGYDAYNIYLHTQRLAYEPTQRHDYVIDMTGEEKEHKEYKYHDIHIELRNYLEKIKYFN